MKHSNGCPPKLRERAVRVVLEHQGEHESHSSRGPPAVFGLLEAPRGRGLARVGGWLDRSP